MLMPLTGCGEDAAADNAAEKIPYIENDVDKNTDAEEKSAPTSEETKNILERLNIIDKMGASAWDVDKNSEYINENGVQYYKSADEMFADTADVRDFLNTYFTEKMINGRYLCILDTDEPACIDVDGALYIKYAPKGGGFAFTDTEPVIKEIDGGKYLILAEFENYGAVDIMEINVVKDENAWKIDSISLGDK